jgi:hypothetical protein
MRHCLLPAVAATALIGLIAVDVSAMAIIRKPLDNIALTTPVIVTGKVTTIEKDTVDAASPYAGATDKVVYKVAVVKIDKALVGADNLTHIKIGFVPPPPMDPNPPAAPPGGIRPGIRRRIPMPELKVDQESVFFLAKHPTADFYVLVPLSEPIDIKTDDGKKQLEIVAKAVEAVADPMKGLKSDKADVRLNTAAKLITRYRAYPVLGGETEQVAIPAEESKLILKTLADADWKANAGPAPGNPGAAAPNPYAAFAQLGLTDKDGWTPPQFPPQPAGAPPVDYIGLQKEAFVKWLAGAGKDYAIKRVVAKKAAGK